jgi:hypothetical protein
MMLWTGTLVPFALASIDNDQILLDNGPLDSLTSPYPSLDELRE